MKISVVTGKISVRLEDKYYDIRKNAQIWIIYDNFRSSVQILVKYIIHFLDFSVFSIFVIFIIKLDTNFSNLPKISKFFRFYSYKKGILAKNWEFAISVVNREN